MQPTLTHILGRATRIRRQLERERRQPRATPSRLLHLQALLLRAQRRLAEFADEAAPRPVPVLAKPSRR